MRAALVQADGRIVRRRKIATRTGDGPGVVLERLFRLMRDVASTAAPEDIRGIGVSAPGPLDPRTGVIRHPPNMPGWDELPLKDLLQGQFGLPVCVGNDANLAALGEHHFGAGAGVDDLVYLTISTGVGSGVITGGRLVLGAAGLAAEAGHIAVEANGPRCACGNIGCLEALASGPAMARQGAAAVLRGEAPGIAERTCGNASAVTGKMVVDSAAAGDPTARQIVERAGVYVGVAVVSLVHLFNPRVVILGGGIVLGAREMLLGPVRRVVAERAMPPFREGLSIVPAALGDNVCLLGAAALWLSESAGE
jgi:glucokinase